MMWNISDDPADDLRRVLRENMPQCLRKLLTCRRCDVRVQGDVSPDSLNLYRHHQASPFFHETADYSIGGLLFLFHCPNRGDLNRRRRMCTDFWRWQEPRGVRRASDWTNLYFHELLCAQFGLLQHQVITMNAVLCAPPATGDPNKPHERQARYCIQNLRNRLEVLKPKIIIAMGKDALAALANLGIPSPNWLGTNTNWSSPARWSHQSFSSLVFVAPHPAAANQGSHYRLHKMHRIWAQIREGINELTDWELAPGVSKDLAGPETEAMARDDCEGGLAYAVNQVIRRNIEGISQKNDVTIPSGKVSPYELIHISKSNDFNERVNKTESPSPNSEEGQVAEFKDQKDSDVQSPQLSSDEVEIYGRASDFYFEFWTEFIRHHGLNRRKAPHEFWMEFGIGKSGIIVAPSVRHLDNPPWIGVKLMLTNKGGQNAIWRYESLKLKKRQIEKSLQDDVLWLEEGEERHIIVRRCGVQATNRSEWPGFHDWLWFLKSRFEDTFRPLVQDL